MKLSTIDGRIDRFAGYGISLLVLLLLTASCSRSDDDDYLRSSRGAKTRGDIIIGAAAPWAKVAKRNLYWQGIEMAVDEINQGGGVLGRRIRIIKEDDEGSMSKGRIVAQAFAENPDVVAVIGHYYSYMSIPMSVIYEYYGLPMLTATCTATKLTRREGFKYIFSIAPTNASIAEQLADYVVNNGYKRLMTYHVNDEYGRDLVNFFETRATELDCTIVDRLSYDPMCDEKYFRRDVEYWKKSFIFDAIFLAGSLPSAAYFIKEARQAGITVPIICGDACDSPMLWELGGKATEGTVVVTLWHPQDFQKKAQEFSHAFTKRYGKQPDTWSAQGYDAVKLLAYAMEKAGSTASGKIAQAISSTKDWIGVTGLHTFNEKGEVIRKAVDLQIVRNGRFELLDNKEEYVPENRLLSGQP